MTGYMLTASIDKALFYEDVTVLSLFLGLKINAEIIYCKRREMLDFVFLVAEPVSSESSTVETLPLKSNKERILDVLLTYAPEKWKEIIEEQGKAWQAFFRRLSENERFCADAKQ